MPSRSSVRRVAVDDRRRHNFRHLRRRAVPLFDLLQRLRAKLEPRFIFRQPLRHARVQIPAEVIEFRLVRECANLARRSRLEMRESENHIRHLHAGVVDVVLHLDALARVAQQPTECVAEHGVAQVADVRGLVRIHARMLDKHLGRIRLWRGHFPSRFLTRRAKEFRAVEERIEVSATRHFHPRDARNRLQRIRDFLRQRARRLLQPLRQIEADGRRHLAHRELRRPLRHHWHVRFVALVDVVPQRLPNPFVDRLVHTAPYVAKNRRL